MSTCAALIRLARARDRLRETFEAPLSIHDAAQAAGMSPYHFIRRFEAAFGWITVVSPEGPEDLELVLEPNANPAAKTFQEALFKQGIPLTAFEVEDLDAEFKRLKRLNVVFAREPTDAGPVRIAVFSDTCGNLIQLYQPRAPG